MSGVYVVALTVYTVIAILIAVGVTASTWRNMDRLERHFGFDAPGAYGTSIGRILKKLDRLLSSYMECLLAGVLTGFIIGIEYGLMAGIGMAPLMALAFLSIVVTGGVGVFWLFDLREWRLNGRPQCLFAGILSGILAGFSLGAIMPVMAFLVAAIAVRIGFGWLFVREDDTE
ncbi:MAG: hypothetical protein OXF62_07685 [Caldilineaceae bacterium]|nr:hypothetical protein [Caldilineaceae bacterium]